MSCRREARPPERLVPHAADPVGHKGSAASRPRIHPRGENGEQGRSLAPVPLNPHIAATFMAPVTRNPDGMRTRRFGPAARHPDIAGAVPAVIAANPDPSGMRTRTGMLNNNRGRADANHNALRERRRQAEERGRGDKKKLLHKWVFSFPKVKFQRAPLMLRRHRSRDGTPGPRRGCAGFPGLKAGKVPGRRKTGALQPRESRAHATRVFPECPVARSASAVRDSSRFPEST